MKDEIEMEEGELDTGEKGAKGGNNSMPTTLSPSSPNNKQKVGQNSQIAN